MASKSSNANLSYAPGGTSTCSEQRLHPSLLAKLGNKEPQNEVEEPKKQSAFTLFVLLLSFATISVSMLTLSLIEAKELGRSFRGVISEWHTTANHEVEYFFSPTRQLAMENQFLLKCDQDLFTNKAIPGLDCISLKNVAARRGRGQRYITPSFD